MRIQFVIQSLFSDPKRSQVKAVLKNMSQNFQLLPFRKVYQLTLSTALPSQEDLSPFLIIEESRSKFFLDKFCKLVTTLQLA